ncbi:MAG: DUF4974 domain-containing protein [Candidatus Pseudobacter hemicellulosilyticus]|uniref:DUF4974 domain-containing protein n=1 Tax=Candidatus Pseudobacter hemicellulosilyticus TaxID=3121375 RepID=A0AAJ5WQ15_9BACT|nr:MAG: DUF4974 domain-containing protein [Pseudobacter sp.]
MNPKEFEEFLQKVALDLHSTEEQETFLAWLQELPESVAAEALDRYEQAFNSIPGGQADQQVILAIETGIESRLGTAPVIPIRSVRRGRSFYLKLAVAVIGILSTSLFFLYRWPATSRDAEQQTMQMAQVIVPGKNQAVLKLANGTAVILDEVADGQITMNNAATGFEKKGGLLVAKGNTAAVVGSDNILETPKGGQYQLALPDGSKVWLNASSRLVFPTSFKQGQRKVQLWGEAYFEVKPDAASPFIVETAKGASLQGQGASFNISAYQEDAEEAATLLAGSLLVGHSAGQVQLKPGQQAIVNTREIVSVKEVETSYAVAWKEGFFMFNREPIKIVMDKIARWYDVEVMYQGPVPEAKFWGNVSRFSHVSDVLKMLEATGRVHFEVEGRKIYVKK